MCDRIVAVIDGLSDMYAVVGMEFWWERIITSQSQHKRDTDTHTEVPHTKRQTEKSTTGSFLHQRPTAKQSEDSYDGVRREEVHRPLVHKAGPGGIACAGKRFVRPVCVVVYVLGWKLREPQPRVKKATNQ